MKTRWLLLTSFLVSGLFTILDGLVHYFYEPLEIYHYPIRFLGIQSPLVNYGISKFASSAVLLLILFYLFAKTKLSNRIQYVSITLVIVLLLEIRYIIGGYYTPTWHILNVINHSVTLFLSIYLVKQLNFGRDQSIPLGGVPST